MIHNIYVDASHSFVTKVSGIGLFDDNGEIKQTFFNLGFEKSVFAEQLAIKKGLEYARINKINHFVIISDCKEAVYNQKFLWKLRKEFGVFSILWKRRGLNKIADELSKSIRIDKEKELGLENKQELLESDKKTLLNKLKRMNLKEKFEIFISVAKDKREIEFLRQIKNGQIIKTNLSSKSHFLSLVCHSFFKNDMLENISNFISNKKIKCYKEKIYRKELNINI